MPHAVAMSALTPVTREMVSRPERSVMWTKVSLKEAKIRATPKTSSPCATVSPCLRDFQWLLVTNLADLGSELDVLLRSAGDLLLGRHVGGNMAFLDLTGDS
jgi:hypothetical protein